MRLAGIEFVAGAGDGSPALSLQAPEVVVLVGPNNAGKSLALREIEAIVFNTMNRTQRKVVAEVTFEFPTDAESALEILDPYIYKTTLGDTAEKERVHFSQASLRVSEEPRTGDIRIERIRTAFSENNVGWMKEFFPPWFTVRLDGRSRFELIDGRRTGNLHEPPTNHLSRLFRNDDERDRVRQLTERAFGLHFTIDPTDVGMLQVRMSLRAPYNPDEERGLGDPSLKFHRAAIPIQEFGDGVQAFTGLVAAIESLPHRIMLIDEPEAFLHPPLARLLGTAIASIARVRAASVVVATHSADILVGCLEGAPNTAVVRLDHDRVTGSATATALQATELANIARDPLMRSTDVLGSLFHRAAIVSESDGDRVFYGEVNRRLLEAGRGVRDAHFVNTLNKQSLYQVVGPLRKLGIPAVAIADLDVIRPNSKWHELLAACGISPERRRQLDPDRNYLSEVFANLARERGGDPIKAEGIRALGEQDAARAAALLQELASFGVFLVPPGEMESWLPQLEVTGHGPPWVEDVLSKIGKTPADANYLRPSENDVWAFVDRIEIWVADPSRSGMGRPAD